MPTSSAPASCSAAAAAITAVTHLAMVVHNSEAAAAYAAAGAAVLPLLRQAGAADGALVATVKDGLRQLHQSASSSSLPPAGALESVTAALQALAAAAAAAATPPAASSAVAPPAAEAPHVPQAGDSCRASSSSSLGKRLASAALPQTAKQQKLSPSWAEDGRPGCWVGEWYIQQQDTVCMTVQGHAALRDSATFAVSKAGATQHVWVFRVEQLVLEKGLLTARFYFNSSRDLQQPLQFQKKAVQLQLRQLSGICYTMAPEREWEVLQQLAAAEFAELQEQLFEAPVLE